MANVTFSTADDTLYAYLAGEIDHDSAQKLRIEIDNAIVSHVPATLTLDIGSED